MNWMIQTRFGREQREDGVLETQAKTQRKTQKSERPQHDQPACDGDVAGKMRRVSRVGTDCRLYIRFANKKLRLARRGTCFTHLRRSGNCPYAMYVSMQRSGTRNPCGRVGF